MTFKSKPYVYVYRDTHGMVLYVGKGTNGRFKMHFSSKPELQNLDVTIQIQYFNAETAALRHERALILEHQPILNKTGVTGSKTSDFGQWLKMQRFQDNPLGDLAQDWIADGCKLPNPAIIERMGLRHGWGFLFNRQGVHIQPIFREAWLEFLQQRPKTNKMAV